MQSLVLKTKDKISLALSITIFAVKKIAVFTC